jgi:membrane fusion protein (multidrug efflux system)
MAGNGKATICRIAEVTQRLVTYLTVALALFIFGTGCKKKKPPPPAPPEVQVLTLTATNLPIFQEWIGTLDGFVNAQIRAQVTGYLLTQNYAEGNKVKAGQPLFQIDPRPFQATLDQATARLAQDQAQVEKNRLDVERFTPLAKDKAISQQQLDDSVQSLNAAQAAIKADQATIENATLNLGFTKIISPVDGLAGLAQVQIGDLVGPSSAVLTTVSALNPMKVYFQVNEQSYLAFWRQFISPENSNSAPPLDLILSDGSTYPEKGKFYFADRQVSIDTGTLQIVGLFSNENFMLRPGQYSRVRAQTQTITNALVVPQRAVAELQGSYQVTVVGESNKVNVVSVKVGQQVGTDWVIADGLKPGERVVVEGTLKAKAGTVVNPKPWPAPTNAPPAK